MGEGRIYYAEQGNNYYLRLVGDVRVTLCTALKTYIDSIFDSETISSVVVDLTEATAADSTTLGLLTKVALHVQAESIKPVMIIQDQSLVKVIESMGLQDIFELVESLPDTPSELQQLLCTKASTDEARSQVLDAHKALMSLNKDNMNTFSELVKSLEREADKSA